MVVIGGDEERRERRLLGGRQGGRAAHDVQSRRRWWRPRISRLRGGSRLRGDGADDDVDAVAGMTVLEPVPGAAPGRAGRGPWRRCLQCRHGQRRTLSSHRPRQRTIRGRRRQHERRIGLGEESLQLATPCQRKGSRTQVPRRRRRGRRTPRSSPVGRTRELDGPSHPATPSAAAKPGSPTPRRPRSASCPSRTTGGGVATAAAISGNTASEIGAALVTVGTTASR